MKNTMYNVLVNQAIDNIKTIIDPTEKVKAIASILPFVDKQLEVEDNSPEVKAVTAEVNKQVENNIIEFKKEENVTVEENKNITETQSASGSDDTVKKFGKMSLRDYMQSDDSSLTESFKAATELKETMKEFFGKHYPERPGFENDLMRYYMILADEENEAVQKDPLNMTVQTYLEKFIPFTKSLNYIYKFDADTIQKTMSTMSNNMYKDGFKDINVNNAGALAAALEEVAAQQNK